MKRAIVALPALRQPASVPAQSKPPESRPAVRQIAPVLDQDPKREGFDGRMFRPSDLDVVETHKSPARAAFRWSLAALLSAGLAWGYFGRLTDYAVVPGKIQAAGRSKVIEPSDAGQVKAIRVADGARVNAGDVLVELDPTAALADRTIIATKLTDLRAITARLNVEVRAARQDPVDTGASIAWESDIPANVRQREEGVLKANLSQIATTLANLTAQRRSKEVGRDGYAHDIEAQKALIALIAERVSMVEGLQRQGWNSKASLLTVLSTQRDEEVKLTSFQGSMASATAAVSVLDKQIAKARETFIANDARVLSENAKQVNDLGQQLAKASQKLTNMILRAPIGGTVHASTLTTLGQVIKPGQQVMQVVPDAGGLEIQAYVQNTDVGFIKAGQEATIKVDAFPFATYGSIPGHVVSVASDALALQGKNQLDTASLDGDLGQTSAAQKTRNLKFPIIVASEQSYIDVNGKRVPLTPGMTVSVELKTEERRALDYIVSPLIDLVTTAGHEQ